jgi:hypothetical protein
MSKVELISSVNVEVEDAFSIPFIGLSPLQSKKHRFAPWVFEDLPGNESDIIPKGLEVSKFQAWKSLLFVFLLFVAVPME